MKLRRLSLDTMLLLAIAGVAIAFTLGKAVHIDDPVHLYAAKAIAANPFHPYAAEILWGWVTPGPISDSTQPPLLFYILGLVSRYLAKMS